jgi:HK97 family phage portal protein
MSIFSRLLPGYKRRADSPEFTSGKKKEKSGVSSRSVYTDEESFGILTNESLTPGDSYLFNAWVNIAVTILTRNIARADFVIKKGGNDITLGPLYDLFRRPNPALSRFDLWKETAAWWHIEGEAFWWFGPDYAGGLPKELYVLNPRKLQHEVNGMGGLDETIYTASRRWFYHAGTELIPILSDELIHFKDWNPWNPVRGVNPLASLSLELEQDYYANKANSQLLKNNAIPQGVLKTEQTLRPEEADLLERRWESKYGAVKAGRKIAVLGKGTSFEPLSFTPEVVKLFELKRWNLYTILAKYGIPPRVANIRQCLKITFTFQRVNPAL